MTVVLPRGPGDAHEPVFAGCHRLNGNGEMTGLEWIRESGMLTTPIAITNTHSVGVVRDALVADFVRRPGPSGASWSLPVVGETSDGLLNDTERLPRPAGAPARGARPARGGPVAEGNVGGGTGIVRHGFKGGIGTASRVIAEALGGYTVGALVQANYGKRDWLRVDGVPVGAEIGVSEVAEPVSTDRGALPARRSAGSGSIIVVVATDAPLLPHQCQRLAQRAGLGIARTGGTGGHTSGDLFVAFATGNRAADRRRGRPAQPGLRRPGGRRRRHRRAVRRRHRGDRGGDRQRSGRRRRRWSGATASPPTPCRTIGWSRS